MRNQVASSKAWSVGELGGGQWVTDKTIIANGSLKKGRKYK